MLGIAGTGGIAIPPMGICGIEGIGGAEELPNNAGDCSVFFARSTRTNVVLCGYTMVILFAARSTMLTGSSLLVVFSMRRRLPLRVNSKWVALPLRLKVALMVPSKAELVSPLTLR